MTKKTLTNCAKCGKAISEKTMCVMIKKNAFCSRECAGLEPIENVFEDIPDLSESIPEFDIDEIVGEFDIFEDTDQ